MDLNRTISRSPELPSRPVLHSDTPNGGDTDEDGDIYRGGGPPSPIVANRLERISSDRGSDAEMSSRASTSSSSSSSSASSAHIVRRAVAAVVELAISRWAQSSTSSDTDSSSSSSAQSSRRPRRRRPRARRNSTSTIAIDPNQRALARQAIEKARRVPRDFHLILPAPAPVSPSPTASLRYPGGTSQARSLQTHSLPTILSHLQSVLKTSTRVKRDQKRAAKPSAAPSDLYQSSVSNVKTENTHPPIPHPSSAMSSTDRTRPPLPSRAAGRSSRGQTPLVRSSVGALPLGGNLRLAPRRRAWWLDVASPTWEDMRDLGTLLHLHPLTLEDILHQDPREKLELFPRLGYYFVVFRAVDSRFLKTGAGASSREQIDELRVTNVYMTVFQEGICSFHFSDLSQHTVRVRDRVMKQGPTTSVMSSDLIAHGLMDSIVDAFIPLIRTIGTQVEALDTLVTGINDENENILIEEAVSSDATLVQQGDVEKAAMVGASKPPLAPVTEMHEKQEQAVELPASSNKATFFPRFTLSSRRRKISEDTSTNPLSQSSYTSLRRAFASASNQLGITSPKKKSSSSIRTLRTETLLKMAGTRKMVVLLTRLLGPKTDILAHLKRRMSGNDDLGAHIGDVQDHILSMQQSLDYYERILSHSHPAYLSFLNLSLSRAKAGSDSALLWLTFVSIGTVFLQVVIGLFSMNIHIPGNRRPTPAGTPNPYPEGVFHWFGAVLSMDVAAAAIFFSVFRYWRTTAKKKYERTLE